MKTTPIVSVLIAVKDGGSKLEFTLESLAKQDLAPDQFEVVICNDGSTDSTGEIIEKWKALGLCQTVLEHQSSQGLTRSLIELSQAACGKYLTRVDAGDFCPPQRLSHELDYLEKNLDVALVATTSLLTEPGGKVIGPLFVPLKKEVTLSHLKRRNFIVHGSIMMRKDAYEAIGGYDASFYFAQDYDLWMRFAAAGKKIHWLKEPLYLLELDAKGISATKVEEQAKYRAQVQGRYGLSSALSSIFSDGLKGTNLVRMRRNAYWRGLAGIGRLLRFLEGLLFEVTTPSERP